MKTQYLIFLYSILLVINSNANSYHYTLSYRDDPSSTISIGWSGDDGIVYYGTTDHGTNYNLYSNNHPSDRVLTHKGQNRKFSRLSNLQPNTIYYFVIHDVSGYTSQRFKFHTLSNSPTSPVSFVSGGDSRDGFSLFGVYLENCPSGDCRQKRKDGNTIISKIRPDFIAFNGDFVQNQITSDISQEWNHWLDDWQLTISSDGKMYPLVLTQGNHEDSSDMYNLFDIPMDEYYTLDIHNGLIRFYSLNSEIGACDNTQLNWLTNDFSNYTNTTIEPNWKIVQHHNPTYAMANYGLNQDQMNCWIDEFELYKVDLVLESHSHTTKWSWPCKKNANGSGFQKDTSNGIVYLGEGQWGAPHRDLDYTGNDKKSWIRDQGVFDGFFFIRTSFDTIQINNVKFDNLSDISTLSDDQLGSSLPSGTTNWNPSNGNTIYITREHTNLIENNKSLNKIYPNPSKSLVKFEFNKNLINSTLELYNSLGKLCVKENLSGVNSHEINIQKLCSGVNYILIKDNYGNVESHKLIKAD